MALTRINNNSLSNVTSAGLPSGTVLQVKQAAKTDVFSTASTSFVDVTDMSVNITPSSTNSKILIQLSLSLGANAGSFACFPRMLRGSTVIHAADTDYGNGIEAAFMFEAGANTVFPLSWTYLDSPSTTSSTTYKLQMRVNTSTGYVNRQSSMTDSSWSGGVSSLTLMEIAG